MKNTRTGQRTIRKLLKGAGSAILLATLFVLVFAGILSGAFGIEENLQQNGIIESNVADAAFHSYADGSIETGTDNASDFGTFTVWNKLNIARVGGSYVKVGCDFTFNTGIVKNLLDSGLCQMQLRYTISNKGPSGGFQYYVKSNNSDGTTLKTCKTDDREQTYTSGWFDVSSSNFYFYCQYYGKATNVGEAINVGFDIRLKDNLGFSGSGTSASPFLLQNRADFDLLSYLVQNGNSYSGQYFKVQPNTANSQSGYIDMLNREFFPIGNGSITFKGIVDGDNKQIRKLTIANVQYAGLFGYVGSGAQLNNITITSASAPGDDYTSRAILAGVVTGTVSISNCHVSGSVSGLHQIGGLVGFARDCTLTISGSTNAASVTGTGCSTSDNNRTSIGGIIGYVNASSKVDIVNSKNTGNITSTASDANGVGGIVGYSNATDSYYVNITGVSSEATNSGNISGNGSAGGIVGYIKKGSISVCSNTGKIENTHDLAYGGRDSSSAYKIVQVDGGAPSGEGFDNLRDGNTDTKYCSAKKNAMSFIIQVSSDVEIVGFSITNANDTAANSSRRPGTVKIWGANTNDRTTNYTDNDNGGSEATSGWASIYNGDGATDATDYKRFVHSFSSARKYNYYWVYIAGSGKVQLSEFALITYADNVGGIVGYADGASTSDNVVVDSATNNGNVIGADNVGGIVGGGLYTSITTSATNSGKITGISAVGGIAGCAGSRSNSSQGFSITNPKNTGDIVSTGGEYVGGISGYSRDTSYIGTTLNEGDVSASNTQRVGGLVGFLYGGSFKQNENKNNEYSVSNKGNVVGGKHTGGIAGVVEWGHIPGATNNGTVTGADNTGGIFGYIYIVSSTKDNLANSTVNNVQNSGNVEGKDYVGGIVGQVETSSYYSFIINNVANTGAVTGGNNVGGIAGKIQNTTLQGNIVNGAIENGQTVKGTSNVGGIVGHVYGAAIVATSVTNYMKVIGTGEKIGGIAGEITVPGGMSSTNGFVNNGNINDANNGNYVGGIFGKVSYLAPNQSVNLTTQSLVNTKPVKGANYVGGFIGVTDENLTISNLTNNDNVTVTGTQYVGGIIGGITGRTLTITNCDNNAEITGEKNVGGILGGSTDNKVAMNISGCSNTKKITCSTTGGNAGGIVGRAYTSLERAKSSTTNAAIYIHNCYNVGEIADTGDCAGGIVGYVYAPIENSAIIEYCYNHATVTGTELVSGIVGGAAGTGYLLVNYCYVTVDAAHAITATDTSKTSVGAIYGGPYQPADTSKHTVTNSWGFYTDETVLGKHNTGAGVYGAYLLVGFQKNFYPVIGTTNDDDWTKIVNNNIVSFYIEEGISVANGYYLALLKENHGEGASVAKSFATPSNIDTLTITANTDGSTAFGIITYSANVAVNANQRNIRIYEEEIGNLTPPDLEYVASDNPEYNNVGKTKNYKWDNDAIRNGYYGFFQLINGYDDVNVTENGYYFNVQIRTDENVVGENGEVYKDKVFGQRLNVKGENVVKRKLQVSFVLRKNTSLTNDNIYRNDAFGLDSLTISRLLGDNSVWTRKYTDSGLEFTYTYTSGDKTETVFTAVGTFSEINHGEYTYTITIGSGNYEFENATGGDITVNTSNEKSWSYKIIPYDLASHYSQGKVWFGASPDMIVTNNALTEIKAPDGTVVASYYPLNKTQGATPQALIYEKVNYSQDKFVIYVQYSNGNVEPITLDTNYTLSTPLATAGTEHVNTGASVTASGEGNFTSTVTKYYVVLDSDFGWSKNGTWGTKDNPYVISTQAQLMRLSQILNGDKAWNSINDGLPAGTSGIVLAPDTRAVATDKTYSGAHFVVTNDIHLDKTFKPIGNADNPFKAKSFSSATAGKLVNINYFYQNASADYVGLFGYVEGTNFNYLYVRGATYTDNGYDGKQIIGNDYVGGLVGYMKGGIINNCTFTSNVRSVGGASIIGNNYVGGLIGYASGTQVLYDTSDANMGGTEANPDNLVSARVTGVNYVGGVIGQWIITEASQFNNGNANGLYFSTTANIIVTSTGSYAGAIAGALDASGCTDNLEIKARLNVIAKVATRTEVNGVNYVGALYGSFIGGGTDKTTVTYTDKDVWATIQFGAGGRVVGGFIGYLQDATLKFNRSYVVDNKSVVFEASSGKTPSFFGGVVGVLGKGANIAGTVLDENNKTFPRITNNVNFGKDHKYGDFVGGIVGYVSSGAGRSNMGSTIFGDDLVFVGQGEIHANNYVGGIFGAIGIIDGYTIADTLLFNTIRYGSTTNVSNANIVTFKPSSAKNIGGIYGTNNVGGLVGGVFKKALIYLDAVTDAENPTFDVSNGANVYGTQYVGGIVGYLEQESHVLNRVVNTGVVGSANASYVGGLVGYMIGGTISNSVSAYKAVLDETTDLYLGSKYVGGLVGFMQGGSLENSLSTGFKFDGNNTSITKGGVVGDKLSPIIEGSWTIYIATAPTYSTVSLNKNGKYVLIDGEVVSEVGKFEYLLAMAGITAQTTYNDYIFKQGELLIGVEYPTKTNFGDVSNTATQPEQLAFYDVSGSDSVMSTPTTVFASANGIVRMGVSMTDGDSYSVCKYDVLFSDISKFLATSGDITSAEIEDARKNVAELANATNDQIITYLLNEKGRKNAQQGYRAPSGASNNYRAEVTTALYDNGGNITRIIANIYFKDIIIGSVEGVVGNYDSGTLTPGDSETTAYTISTQAEWNDFAWSIYTGQEDYRGKYVKLLTNITIDKKTTHTGTNNASYNFNSEITNHSYNTGNETDSVNAKSNLGYNMAGNIAMGAGAMSRVTFVGSVSAGSKIPSFKGTFDGNGYTITINYQESASRASVFPNAQNATFKNLTVDGYVKATGLSGGYNDTIRSMKDYNLLSSKTGNSATAKEGIFKISDGDTGTKCYSANNSMSFVAEFVAPLAISGFAITNGGDNEVNPTRTVKKVMIWGSNKDRGTTMNHEQTAGAWANTSDGWTLVYNNSNINIGNKNTETYNRVVSNTVAYKYYWVYLEASGGGVQLSEFGFLQGRGYDCAGFVGKPFGNLTFTNCKNKADINAYRNAAGILGFNDSGYTITLESCVNEGNITSLEGSFTLDGRSTKYSYDEGWGYAAYSYGTGGIIGSVKGNLEIQSCRNTGRIIGGHNVGGIIGCSDGISGTTATLIIDSCANSGYILANSGYWSADEGNRDSGGTSDYEGKESYGIRLNIFGYAGGLVGRTGSNSILKMYASYNSGEVTCLANMVGGLVGGVGYLYQKEATVNYVITGGKSVIAYCYNTGNVNAGGTFPKHTKNLGIGGAVDQERENDGGTVVGGIAGIVGNILITDCYNVGDVTAHGITAYKRSWQLRAGGIVGHSEPQPGNAVEFNRCYNIGTIKSRHILNTMGANWDTTKDLRYGASISGYCDNVNNSASRVSATNCYSIAYSVSIRVANQEKKIYEYRNKNFNSWKSDERRVNWLFASGIFGIGDAQEYCVKTGDLCTNYRDLTALMKSNSSINVPGTGWKMGNAYNNFNGTDTTFNLTASYASIGANLSSYGTNTGSYPSGWIFVYGCLPQLAVFAVDTYNGLSMRSVNYGRDVYGTYQREIAGEEYSPFVIKDGIDLLGLQTLVDMGYSFEGKYVEFANGTNNLEETASKVINMPVDGTEYTSTSAYQYSEDGTNYSSGKSYHLFSRGSASDYVNWKNANYRYTAGDTLTVGATFANQNFIAIGRKGGNSVFKGHISGAQTDGSVTEIANLRIANKEVAGLFGYVQDAEVHSVGASGTVIAYADGTNSNSRSVAGGIVAVAYGASIIDGCEAGSQNRPLYVYAYGKTQAYNNNNTRDITTSAGGIVGLANTVRFRSGYHSYSEGTTAIISNNKVVNAYVRSAKNNIGGIVGLATGTLKYPSNISAKDKNNKVEISAGIVEKAEIGASDASGATLADVGTRTGGIIGYSDENISIIVRECVVGTDSAPNTVTIQGENSIGGIVGETPDAVNEIIGCKVLKSVTIKRASNWGVVTNAGESGTAIGGIVGLTYNASGTDPITTTFSGNIVFKGKIVIDVQTKYISASNRSNDGAVRNVGGIVGDMGSGARIATGSNIEVGGTIEISAGVDDNHSNRNIGGVAGRTKDVAFSGTFKVAPTITAKTAYQVGGFIGKNNGIVNILADDTDIQIGGNITASHDVGGFIGYNSALGTLLIGADQYRAVNYNDGLSIKIVASVSDADKKATIDTLIKGERNNVGGIVGNSEQNGVVKIVKGTIVNVGQVAGQDNVGGIIGINNGTLSTGGSVYDTTLEIVNEGKVNGNDFVGGVIGKLNIGQIVGRFINRGNVSGRDYVGGSIGYVAKDASVLSASAGKTEFINEAVAIAGQSDALVASDATTADDSKFNVSGRNYVGGSIGLLLGRSLGNEEYKVEFRSKGTVNGDKYVGGSIGVLAGKTEYTDFISEGEMTGVGATTAVGGSVGFIGVPNPLTAAGGGSITASDVNIVVSHTHFEANGTLTLNDTNGKPEGVGEYVWGGIGGAIGAIGNATDNLFDNTANNRWTNNTYYASGNVTAKGFFHVGGIVGLIKADNITIENMLAYDTKVTGGKNVGGIVGATIGKKTVINSAFSISTNENGGIFTAPQGNAGGIIGFAQEDTDASTSYWVKGYTNAELAGSSVTNLKTTLGRYTLAYEVYAVDGKEVTVVFTKELIGTGTTAGEGGETGDEEVAIYPTPYAYYESVGTHKATNDKTYTINEEEITEDNGYILIDENLTWQAYFDMTFGTGKIKYQKDVGAWVEEKSNWTEYSTGTKQTGWYFVYANDQQGGNNQIGKVDAVHSISETVGYSDLWYWKRIANAYTMDERNAGYDDDSKVNSPYAQNPLNSAIVREITKGETADDDTVSTVPHKGTLYATATAANFKNNPSASGYYMYIASSGKTKPTSVNHDGKFFIQAEGGVSQNVAVYYRSIAMGSALTYNGYERYAPISLSNDIKYDSTLSDQSAVNPDNKNSYFYNTVNKDNEKPKIAKTYYTTVSVYYFDDEGKPYVVGGINEGTWRIKERSLTFSATDVIGKKYGDDDIKTTVTITDIAYNDINNIEFVLKIEGLSTPITLNLKNGKEFTENQGVKFGVVNVSANPDIKLKGTDTKYNVGTYNSETGILRFDINFKNAKNYDLSVNLKSTELSKNYKLSNAKKQITVEKAKLEIKRVEGAPKVVFDNQTHSIKWQITGFKFGETLNSIAMLSPKVFAEVDQDKTYTESLIGNTNAFVESLEIATENGNRKSNITIAVSQNDNSISLSGAKLKGTYYLAFDKQEADDCNYKLDVQESEKLIISENLLTVKWGSETGHVYNKTAGTFTATVTAKEPIESLEVFVEEYFVITGKVKVEKYERITDKKEVKITFKTDGYNAAKYTVTLSRSDKILEVDCSFTIQNNKPSKKEYEITKRPLKLTYQMTGTGNTNTYVYNSYHQGLMNVTVNDILSGDKVSVTISGSLSANGTLTADNSKNRIGNWKEGDKVGTIDANDNDYTVSVKLGSGDQTGNYEIAATTYSWKITKKTLTISGLSGQNVTYDGKPHAPTPTLSDVSNGKFGQDTISINYTVTGGNASFVNAGDYIVSVPTSNKITAKHEDGTSATDNYSVDGEATAKFTIAPRELKLSWTNNKLVFNNNKQGQTIATVTADDGKVFTFVSSSITNAKFKGYAGNDTITFKLENAQRNAGTWQMKASIQSVTDKNADGSDSSIDNYKIVEDGSSCKYTIDKSVLNIERTGGDITKVYDATTYVPQDQLDGLSFDITSTNKGDHSLGSSAFNITATYLNKNVGTNIGIRISYSLKPTYNTNYSYESASEEVLIGTITPATITVTLDRLRNGRATRTFAEDKNGNISVYYGGANGAINGQKSNRSQTYRLGEGFTISGFPSAETTGVVKVLAKYVEVGTDRASFDGYVNYIYDSGNGVYVKGTANDQYVKDRNLYKALEFSIEDVNNSGKAANYNFKVVDTSGDSITGDAEAQLGTVGKAIRVYDANDQKNENVGKQAITIEITVKTYKIKYDKTTQSYANSDGSYNKEWAPVVAIDLPTGIQVEVKNGWMTDENGHPKIYKQYTVIRGRANSTELSASVSGSNGKQLNYNMTNQPVLTIGYFVEENSDTFEIGSLSSLLIASYYWWVSANSGDPEFNQVINTTVTWNALISDAEYEAGATFNRPEGVPETVTTWDEYFLWLETDEGGKHIVFLNENENNTWGYYTTTTGAGDVKKYSSFKQVRDINGTFTQSDIEMLNGFFRVYDVNTNTYIDKEWGYGKDDAFINNFLKVGVGNVAVAIGSIFKSLENGFTGAYDGGGYVIEYFNIMSFDGAENVGMFDVLGGNATVKNLHLRNFTINANAGNVGGIAGKALAGENVVENVSWHGTISMSGNGNVGGLIGVSARSINKAIALGTINAKGGNIGGLIGSIEQGVSVAISNAVSFVYVEATSNVGAITASSSGATATNAFYLASSAWTRSSGTLAVSDGALGTAKTYTQLMQGSVSGYSVSESEYYRYAGTKLGGDFDMLDDFNYSEQTAENIQKMNARQSLRLKDIVDVYMLMYDVKETSVTIDSTPIKVYTISSSSWLVGDKHGVYGDEIEIGNRQQVALLRELRFASFVLTSDVVATATSGGDYAYGGAFFGNVECKDGTSYTIDFGSGKRAFEALATVSNVPHK